jgi:AcrR family transcriptional regulator
MVFFKTPVLKKKVAKTTRRSYCTIQSVLIRLDGIARQLGDSMARPDSKEVILDAAESVVLEHGAAHMTLDAVAERAGISKGGLMYNFPTKEALLVGMIRRLCEEGDKLDVQKRQGLSLRDGENELLVQISVLAGLSGKDFRRHAALLAVVSSRPDLLEPFRKKHQERFKTTCKAYRNPKKAMILLYAAIGLHFDELLAMNFVGREERKEIFDELISLASGKESAAF